MGVERVCAEEERVTSVAIGRMSKILLIADIPTDLVTKVLTVGRDRGHWAINKSVDPTNPRSGSHFLWYVGPLLFLGTTVALNG